MMPRPTSESPRPCVAPLRVFARRNACIVLAVLCLASCECGTTSARAPSAPRARVRELSAPRASAVARTAGMAGDWALEGNGVRVLIGGLRRPARDRGRVLALATVGASPSDDFESLVAMVASGDRTYSIDVDDIEATTVAGRDAIRVSGHAALPAGALEVDRIYTVADVAGAMAIYTRVHGDTRDHGEGVSIAERVAWGGQPPFVPGPGRVADDAWHEASWMGTEGSERSIVIGSRSGRGRVRGDVRAQGDHPYLQATELTISASARPIRSVIATSRGPLADALRRFGWARGRPFREASVAVVPLPPRAAIRVAGAEGPWLRSRVRPSGRVQVPLPDDDRALTVRATAYGHAASGQAPIGPGARVRLRIPPSGRLRIAAVDASSREAIPFRVRVIGAGSTRAPELGPIWSASGARDVAASVGPPIELPLPLGEYRVVVTHGPEWSLEERSFVVTGARLTELEVPLRRAMDPGAWIASDFHLHAAPSPDSHVTLQDRVTALVAEGVRYAVPTDHNYVTDYAPAVHALGVALGTIPGVEVTTWEPGFGHFNAFPYPLDPELPSNGAPGFSGLTPGLLFASLRERSPGSIVQVNHPRLEPSIGYFDRMGFDPRNGAATGPYSENYDTIEVWNGFDLTRAANVERNLVEWIGMLARGRRVVATGSSDSHTVRTEWAGYPRTYVYVEGGIETPPVVIEDEAEVDDAELSEERSGARVLPAHASGAARRAGQQVDDAEVDDAELDETELSEERSAARVLSAHASGAERGAGQQVDEEPALGAGALHETAELAIDDAGLDAGGRADAQDGAVLDAGERAHDAGTPDAGALVRREPRVRESDWRLVRALREGRAYVTNGPLVDVSVDGRGPGDTVSVRRRRAQLSIDVRAPAWIDVSTIDVYVGRTIARTIPIRVRRARRGDPPGLRARERIELRITEPTFVLAVVRGEATMDALFGRRGIRPLAFTNPIWLVP